jgi:membrane protease YdiL (CAAX protease family)
LIIVGIGEEVGWRGWLLPQLQKRFSPLSSSLILGLVWGAWHFPLFVIGAYPGGPESIVVYLVIGPIFATLFTWLFNRTRGALLPAICLHTAVNNSSRFVAETSMYPVLLIVFVVAVVIMDRMWKHARSS